MKVYRFFLPVFLWSLFSLSSYGQNNVVIGNGLVLTPLPTPPVIETPPVDEGENEDGDDAGDQGNDEGRGRSIASAFYLSLDDHTIYAYPDGTHDVMTLWVCDMQGNVIEEVIFEMNGTRQSHVLPASLAGEYEVYLKVGGSYYTGTVWI